MLLFWSLLGARQLFEELVRGKPKRKTRKWEFQGQTLDMSWDKAKEWSTGEGKPKLGLPRSVLGPQGPSRVYPTHTLSLYHRTGENLPALAWSGVWREQVQNKFFFFPFLESNKAALRGDFSSQWPLRLEEVVNSLNWTHFCSLSDPKKLCKT